MGEKSSSSVAIASTAALASRTRRNRDIGPQACRMGGASNGRSGLAPMVARARRDDHQSMLNDFAQRLRVWWLREELDERLAHGADPDTDPLLTRRAAQLTTRSTRTDIAEGLESALAEARKAWSMSARLPLRRAEIRACAD